MLLLLPLVLPSLAAEPPCPDGVPRVATFANPPELPPNASGVYELRLGPVEHVIAGRRHCLRAYNGMVPGPTIRTPAGTSRKVRVELHNDFTRPDFRETAGLEGTGEVACHDFNMTNLHAHGSHIRPDYATFDPADPCTGSGCGPGSRYHGDNVLHHVEHGEMAQFRWDLDEDGIHHAGLNWYHPHIHGSTAIQVTNGAAGAWIVEGDLDLVPGVANAAERIIVINHIPYTSEYADPLRIGETCSEDTLSLNNFLGVETPSPMLVNGMRKPRLVTPPNQVERWRILHAGTPDEMVLTVYPGLDPDCTALNVATPVPMMQIAADGITLPQPYTRPWTFMASGYRVESMLKMPPVDQTLCLCATRSDVPQTPAPDDVILIVNVDGSAGPPTETNLPTAAALAAVAPATSWMGNVNGQVVLASCPTVSTIHQKVVLLVPAFKGASGHHHRTAPAAGATGAGRGDTGIGQVTGGPCDPNSSTGPPGPPEPCSCPEPNINCRRFDDRRRAGYETDRVMTLGTTEKWQIMATDGHPFHIHVNPFVVCTASNPREPPFPHWRDTFFVSALDGPQEILTEFRAFPGRFTLHCHKLNHEDEGMMELVEICAPGDDGCLCLDTATEPCVGKGGCRPDDEPCLFAQRATLAFPAPVHCQSVVGPEPVAAAAPAD